MVSGHFVNRSASTYHFHLGDLSLIKLRPIVCGVGRMPIRRKSRRRFKLKAASETNLQTLRPARRLIAHTRPIVLLTIAFLLVPLNQTARRNTFSIQESVSFANCHSCSTIEMRSKRLQPAYNIISKVANRSGSIMAQQTALVRPCIGAKTWLISALCPGFWELTPTQRRLWWSPTYQWTVSSNLH